MTQTGKPIGIAVVGAGYWGPNLVRNAQQTPGLHLQYLCDLDTDRATAVLGGYSTVRVSGSSYSRRSRITSNCEATTASTRCARTCWSARASAMRR